MFAAGRAMPARTLHGMLRRPRTALLGALACLVSLAITGVLSHLVHAAKVSDSASLRGFASFDSSSLDGILNGVAHTADPASYLLVLGGLVATALIRGRRRLALMVPAVLLIAPVSTEVLKQLTAQPRGHGAVFRHISDASWPSGHSTGAMALALCAVLVAPPRLRPLVATLGGIYAMSVGYAVVALVWHFPSDVVGGFLVAAGWTLVAVAVLRRWPDQAAVPPRMEAERMGWGAAGAVACAFGLAALTVAFSHRGALADELAARPVFAIAAGTIAALAAGLAAALVRSTR